MPRRSFNFSSGRAPTALLALIMSTHVYQGKALQQSFCSSDNSGSGSFSKLDIYMSNGECFDACKANYNYAVVQYQSCWCATDLPNTSVSLSQCGVKCPGYGYEMCGDKEAGLYGYIALPNAPSGAGAIIGGGSSSGSSSSQSSFMSSTAPPPTSSSSSDSFTSSSSSSSETPSPVTSISVITRPGGVVTTTITSSPSIIPDSSSQQTPLASNPVSGGEIAGIVIGVLAGVALILAGVFFCLRRRKTDESASAVDANGRVKRTTSVLSRTGLLTSRHRGQSMAERDNDAPLYINTNTGNTSERHSALFGSHPGHEEHVAVTPNSPLGGSSDGSRRQSRPMVYDQRLNPSALFANAEANGSRVSMQDQQDYSRPLGVMNPDPRPSFESRLSHDNRPGH